MYIGSVKRAARRTPVRAGQWLPWIHADCLVPGGPTAGSKTCEWVEAQPANEGGKLCKCARWVVAAASRSINGGNAHCAVLYNFPSCCVTNMQPASFISFVTHTSAHSIMCARTHTQSSVRSVSALPVPALHNRRIIEPAMLHKRRLQSWEGAAP